MRKALSTKYPKCQVSGPFPSRSTLSSDGEDDNIEHQTSSMDASVFEVRLQFTEMLGNLAFGKKYIGACGNYSMKHYSFHVDLFDCILTELTDAKSTPVYLKNIMILLESICSTSLGNSWFGFRDLFEQNIKHVCHGILHSKRQRDYHIDYIVKLLDVYCRRHWFQESTVQYIHSYVQKYTESHPLSPDEKPLDKLEFLERMEEDRDQQKRFRELSWFRNPQEDPLLELDSILESLSDWNSEDERDVLQQRARFTRAQELPMK